MSVDSGFVFFNSMLHHCALGENDQQSRAARPGFSPENDSVYCPYLNIQEQTTAPLPRMTSSTNGFCTRRVSDGMVASNCVHSSEGIGAPIIDYEIVGKQHTFTVYRIHVVTPARNWFVFRRYRDFEKLNQRLQCTFPGFKLKLPKKRWFRNNFDNKFIESRRKGLQRYIDILLKHELLSVSELLEDFLCISDPPGPFDNIEECRAFCEQLEGTCHRLHQKVEESYAEMHLMKSQLSQARVQQDVLVSALKAERVRCKKYINLYKDLEQRNSFPILTEVCSQSTQLDLATLGEKRVIPT